MEDQLFVQQKKMQPETFKMFQKCVGKRCRISQYYKKYGYYYTGTVCELENIPWNRKIAITNIQYHQPLVINLNNQKQVGVIERQVQMNAYKTVPLSEFKAKIVERYGFQSKEPYLNNSYIQIFDETKKMWICVYDYTGMNKARIIKPKTIQKKQYTNSQQRFLNICKNMKR